MLKLPVTSIYTVNFMSYCTSVFSDAVITPSDIPLLAGSPTRFTVPFIPSYGSDTSLI
jgi:hypothetical protein